MPFVVTIYDGIVTVLLHISTISGINESAKNMPIAFEFTSLDNLAIDVSMPAPTSLLLRFENILFKILNAINFESSQAHELAVCFVLVLVIYYVSWEFFISKLTELLQFYCQFSRFHKIVYVKSFGKHLFRLHAFWSVWVFVERFYVTMPILYRWTISLSLFLWDKLKFKALKIL